MPAGSSASEPIRRFYADWTQYRSRLVEAVRALSADQLALSAGPDHAPIWALAAHCAGTRTYWLCGVLAEPGADDHAVPRPVRRAGWEDDPEHPRSAAELVDGARDDRRDRERCLDTWTSDILEASRAPLAATAVRAHAPVDLLRLLSHDAFHSGEISQLLGANGLPADRPVGRGGPSDPSRPPSGGRFGHPGRRLDREEPAVECRVVPHLDGRRLEPRASSARCRPGCDGRPRGRAPGRAGSPAARASRSRRPRARRRRSGWDRPPPPLPDRTVGPHDRSKRRDVARRLVEVARVVASQDIEVEESPPTRWRSVSMIEPYVPGTVVASCASSRAAHASSTGSWPRRGGRTRRRGGLGHRPESTKRGDRRRSRR